MIQDALSLEWARKFPQILLDAPCSALGTVRHNPDILLHRNLQDIAMCQEKQFALLQKSWSWLEPKGELLYAVCTLEPEEGADIIERFLASQPDAALSPITPENLPLDIRLCVKDGSLTLFPHLMGGIDGFFAARLTKV